MLNEIRDWLGRLVKQKDLSSEVAQPQLGTVRDPFSDHPGDGMTAKKLASILREADEGETKAYFELAEDIEERDPHYLAVLGTRRRSVAQLPITVTPASDSPEHQKHAQFLQDWIKTGVLRSSMFDVLDAIGRGLSIMEIDWQYRNGMMVPAALKYRPQRWFTFDRNDGETVLMRDQAGALPLVEHKFIVHRHKAKSGLTVRSGLARVACWSWMFKAFTTKDWAIFAQNYGSPLRIGKYGKSATDADKKILWRAVSQIAGDCAAIIPEDMLLEFHEVGNKGGSTDLFERRADWLDRQVSKLVLGQTTTTDAVAGGHAVSKEHRLVQEDIERSDGLQVSTSYNEQLVPNIIAFNFGPQDHYPQINIGRPDELPIDQFANAVEKFAKVGVTFSAQELRDRIGAKKPEPDEEIVGGRVAVPSTTDPQPVDPTARQAFDRLFTSRHASSAADPVDLLTSRLEQDAAGALGGMLDEVRKAIEQASDLRDAADRLSKLNLSSDQLAEAMARGMALAHLAGQAAMVDAIKVSK